MNVEYCIQNLIFSKERNTIKYKEFSLKGAIHYEKRIDNRII